MTAFISGSSERWEKRKKSRRSSKSIRLTDTARKHWSRGPLEEIAMSDTLVRETHAAYRRLRRFVPLGGAALREGLSKGHGNAR